MPYKDPEARKVYQREYYRKWSDLNKDKVRSYQAKISPEKKRAYGQKHQELHLEARREYKKIHARKRRAKELARHKGRYLSDPGYNLRVKLRNRIGRALADCRNNALRADRIIVLLGCSYIEYLAHIERQFTEGMTWERLYAGDIEIDHIRPCASFDLSDPEQQRACFHFTNLQPLWGPDNLRKGARYNGVLYRNIICPEFQSGSKNEPDC